MRRPFAIVFGLIAALRIASADAIILDKGVHFELADATQSSPGMKPPARAFMDTCLETKRNGIDFDAALPLVNPPGWGRAISRDTQFEVK